MLAAKVKVSFLNGIVSFLDSFSIDPHSSISLSKSLDGFLKNEYVLEHLGRLGRVSKICDF